MAKFQKYFSQTTFHHHFQARNAKISPIFHFDGGHNGRICHILYFFSVHLSRYRVCRICEDTYKKFLSITFFCRRLQKPAREVHVHLPNGDVFPFETCHLIIAAGAESGHIANLAGMGIGKVIFFLSKQKMVFCYQKCSDLL